MPGFKPGLILKPLPMLPILAGEMPVVWPNADMYGGADAAGTFPAEKLWKGLGGGRWDDGEVVGIGSGALVGVDTTWRGKVASTVLG